MRHTGWKLSPDPDTHKRVITGAGSSLRLAEPQQETGGGKRRLGLGRQEAVHLAVALAPESEACSPVSNAQ